MSAFHVDARIALKLHFDLAVRLGEIILNSRPNDGQLRALGHNLVNLDEDTAKRYAPSDSTPEWDEDWQDPELTPEWKQLVSVKSKAAVMQDKVAARKIRYAH